MKLVYKLQAEEYKYEIPISYLPVSPLKNAYISVYLLCKMNLWNCGMSWCIFDLDLLFVLVRHRAQ